MNNNLLKFSNNYEWNTKIHIQENINKDIYRELVDTYFESNINEKLYFKRYIIEIFFNEIYKKIYYKLLN